MQPALQEKVNHKVVRRVLKMSCGVSKEEAKRNQIREEAGPEKGTQIACFWQITLNFARF